jgi:hypothetical protein
MGNRVVTYIDDRGRKIPVALPSGVPDSAAPLGVPIEHIDVDELDWDEIKRDLHNQLVDAGLFTWNDVQRAQNAITGLVNLVVAKRLLNHYRQVHYTDRSNNQEERP